MHAGLSNKQMLEKIYIQKKKKNNERPLVLIERIEKNTKTNNKL